MIFYCITLSEEVEQGKVTNDIRRINKIVRSLYVLHMLNILHMKNI